ncbi:tail knob protein [Bacillus phage DLn1]|nr:tail knob protein [Bacillus phage DLn1]
MAVVPVSGSNVFFLKGVPFTNDYKNTRYFENAGDQFNYFNGRPKVHSMVECTFVQNDDKSYVSADASIDELRDVSYMMFQNAQYHNKWYYAFVTKLTRKTSNTTHVYFQIDVLQTWLFNIEWKPSFVVREHCPLWTSSGSPIVNTIDEGLHYGLEYDDVKVNHYVPNQGIKWMVVIAKELMHGTNAKKSEATYTGIAQPFSYYVLPFTISGEPITLKEGDDSQPFSSPEKFLTEFYGMEGATNNIVSIFMTESIGCPIIVRGGEDTPYNIEFTEKDQKLDYVTIGEGDKMNQMLYVKDVKRFKTETFELDGRYEGIPNYRESKLYMYPYTILTVDDMKGNRTDYRLEYLPEGGIKLNLKGSIGTSNNVTYTLQGYNNRTDSLNHLDNQYGLININPNDIPVITELISAYLQGNKNSLENQKNQILLGGVSGVAQNILGGAGSAMGKSPLGVAQSGVGAVTGAGQTALQLQALEAKQEDIKNVPPQLNKMGSNNSYSMGHRYDGVTLIKKTLKPEYAKKLSDYFNMFGYKKHEVKIPNLHTRKNWNYVETKDCNVIGDFNTEDLREIRSIFDGGITLWHTNDVGNYDLSNEVI